ncbi:MAG TPA: twin-arginine translocation signal domain-containing protein, partial [Candidatus Hydrogenedentes bacterium]|nr:twin-arginine translocation signal domain-containing protein [Candidatus Hydrogenedentota bacterium]
MGSKHDLNRRDFFRAAAVTGGAVLGAGVLTSPSPVEARAEKRYQEGVSPWPLVLNTSTIRPASLEEKIRVTAEAGWDGIEPWINELNAYEEGGGDLKELGAQIR